MSLTWVLVALTGLLVQGFANPIIQQEDNHPFIEDQEVLESLEAAGNKLQEQEVNGIEEAAPNVALEAVSNVKSHEDIEEVAEELDEVNMVKREVVEEVVEEAETTEEDDDEAAVLESELVLESHVVKREVEEAEESEHHISEVDELVEELEAGEEADDNDIEKPSLRR